MLQSWSSKIRPYRSRRGLHFLFIIENRRKPFLTGSIGRLYDDVVGDEPELDLSLEELVMLPRDSDRCLVSARTSSRLTLSRENGVVFVSRISVNFEPAIVE